MNRNTLDYNQITEYLYIGTTPSPKDYKELSNKGIKLIINMRAEKYAIPTGVRRSIKTIWIPSLDSRFTPINIKRIAKAVGRANDVIADGGGVYVYCREGRHRSVALAVAILISQGYNIDAAIKLVKSKRVVADPEVPHIYKVITTFLESLRGK